MREGRSKPTAFKDASLIATPRAASTALMAGRLFMCNKSRVRATADAMSCSGEEAPALAA